MTQDNKNTQPQAGPYIVKSHDIHIDADYADWIADIKHRYRSAQVKAAIKVNAEKLLFNWQLGPKESRGTMGHRCSRTG